MKQLFLFILGGLLFPGLLFASEIRVDSRETNIQSGDAFIVDVVLRPDEEMNAIEGQIVLPSGIEALEVRDGDSAVQFWVDPPTIANGRISFSGITPGGFQAGERRLFSVVLRADAVGRRTIDWQNAVGLLNDGVGTRASLETRSTTISVVPGDSQASSVIEVDVEEPEAFAVQLINDPLLFDGMATLVYSTQDKATGIASYELRETRFGPLSFLSPWRVVESPTALRDQKLRSDITLRALDYAENERVITMAPRYPLRWYERIEIYCIIGVAVFTLALCFAFWRKRKN